MKNFRKNSLIFIIVATLGMLILLIIRFNSRITEMRQLDLEAEKVKVEVTMLRQTQMVLQTQIAYATSDAAVEAWAYEEAKMKREGDQLVVPLSPEKSTPLPSKVEIAIVEPVENWQVWQALFFEETLP